MTILLSRRRITTLLGATAILPAALSLAGCGGPGGSAATAANSGEGRLDIPETPASDATKALWEAAKEGDLAGIDAALKAGADIEGIDFSENRNGRRALNYAALNDQAAAIEALLAAGANIESQNRTRFTPLHHAAEAGSINAINVLLKHGANKKAKMYRGGIPQQIAEFKGHREAALLLVP